MNCRPITNIHFTPFCVFKLKTLNLLFIAENELYDIKRCRILSLKPSLSKRVIFLFRIRKNLQRFTRTNKIGKKCQEFTETKAIIHNLYN